MSVFLSKHSKVIDERGRILTPSSFRGSLSKESFQGFVAFKSNFLPTLDCFSMSKIEKLSFKYENEDPFSKNWNYNENDMFADAEMITFDKAGRIKISEELLNHCKIEKELIFAGRGSSFQIWSPELFADNQNNSRRKIIARQESKENAENGNTDIQQS
ncbi:division/cell wall cluster transcriptional repressor MraZ [Candidatus Nesciobacter abundans]|uniref:Transcriptional regulator MraZ n=1 Tax=Candidatus Nesciobacter abundans TaxID=2601668 RepID=A0A5C0UHD2_9PROT|nr:hypothetical protein [Candidatus Nesciobacter abundans]QEK38963.1 hypothetical protein FZC36_00730 [Candidatus Nesciobacter abundans]